MHQHCCNRHMDRCCPAKKHESNSHFNQFVHSTNAKKFPLKSAKLPKNDQHSYHYKTGQTRLIKPPAPYMFWPQKPQQMNTKKLKAAQQYSARTNFNKMPINRVLMTKQQH